MLFNITPGADLDKKVFVEAVNDCVSCINSAERRFPSLVISSDSFTETDDEGHDGSLAKNVTPSPKKKKKVRKPGFIRNLLLSSKTNLLEEKVTQGEYFSICTTLVNNIRYSVSNKTISHLRFPIGFWEFRVFVLFVLVNCDVRLASGIAVESSSFVFFLWAVLGVIRYSRL